jgi:hypothetical protein
MGIENMGEKAKLAIENCYLEMTSIRSINNFFNFLSSPVGAKT